MQTGFLFTTKPLMPNFGKLDPIKGFKNLFSIKKLIETVKTLLKSQCGDGCCVHFFVGIYQRASHRYLFPFV
jgi:flagellar biosynthesis protein FlhB